MLTSFTTLKTLAENIASLQGVSTDPLEVERIKRRVLHFRQLIIKREYEKTRVFHPSLIQAFDIKLSKVEKEGSQVYISETLPSPIIVKRGFPFISVSNSLLDTNRKVYGFINPEEISYLPYRQFTKVSDYYSYENSRIFTFVKKDSLRVRAVWENPLEVLTFSQDQDIKIGCKVSTLESTCFFEDDLMLEETIAGAIMSFFSNGTQNTRNSRAEQDQEERAVQ